MHLNDLSLAELRKLSDQLTSIAVSGFRLEQDGLAPRFDLTPGRPMRITLAAAMPEGSSLDAIFGPMDDQVDFTPSTEAAPPEPALEPVDAPLAPGEAAEGAPISAELSRSDDDTAPPPAVAEATPPLAEAASFEASAESGGEAVMAAAQPPAAPAPGSASAMAAQAGQWAGAWTDAQDDMVVDAMATAHIAGTPKADALHSIAAKVGRSVRAVEQRAYRIGGKIKAEVARRAMAQAQTEAPEIPEAAPSPGQGETAVGGHSPAADQASDPLTTHLRAVTDKGGWSLARDLELMELSCEGWQPNEIALQLTMQANAIKPRFDTLTGLHDDPVTGKKARRWTCEEVLGALLVMAGKAAA